jgi:hypothetical protein
MALFATLARAFEFVNVYVPVDQAQNEFATRPPSQPRWREPDFGRDLSRIVLYLVNRHIDIDGSPWQSPRLDVDAGGMPDRLLARCHDYVLF